jgi:hypothetical protein
MSFFVFPTHVHMRHCALRRCCRNMLRIYFFHGRNFAWNSFARKQDRGDPVIWVISIDEGAACSLCRRDRIRIASPFLLTSLGWPHVCLKRCFFTEPRVLVDQSEGDQKGQNGRGVCTEALSWGIFPFSHPRVSCQTRVYGGGYDLRGSFRLSICFRMTISSRAKASGSSREAISARWLEDVSGAALLARWYPS